MEVREFDMYRYPQHRLVIYNYITYGLLGLPFFLILMPYDVKEDLFISTYICLN